MESYPIRTTLNCTQMVLLVATMTYSVSRVIHSVLIPVDVLLVFHRDLGQHYHNAHVCHFRCDLIRNRVLVVATGRCSIPVLFTYLQTSPGIRVNRSLSFIFTTDEEENLALGRSNVTTFCANGFRNVGGSLTIVCMDTNNWTPFPNCTAIPTTTTTTVPPPLRCPVTDDTLQFANGYLFNTRNLTIYDDDTAKGNESTRRRIECWNLFCFEW